MEHFYNIVFYTFGFVGGISTLLLGVSFTKGQRNKYPFLKRLDGRQLHIAGVAVLSIAIVQASGYGRDRAGLETTIESLKKLGVYETAIDSLLAGLGRESSSVREKVDALHEVLITYQATKSELEKYEGQRDDNIENAEVALNSLEFEKVSEFVVANSFVQAKKNLDSRVFNDPQTRKTLYCGCLYNEHRVIEDPSCSFVGESHRSKRMEWDHIVPISWIGIRRPCWDNLSCKRKDGSSYGGRHCCSEIDPYFNQAQNDLHNIRPSIGEINGRKSNLEINYVGSHGKLFGCGLLLDSVGNRIEPPNNVKGDVARVVLYMVDTYNVPISFHQENLMREWSSDDPVSEEEIEINKRIYELQGNSNPYIKALPNP